jgi:hypothetical protein
VISRSVLLDALAVIGIVLVVEFLAAPILGSAWDASIRLVPIMAMSALPATRPSQGALRRAGELLAWSTAALHVSRGTAFGAIRRDRHVVTNRHLRSGSGILAGRPPRVHDWLLAHESNRALASVCCCILLVFAAGVTITS